MENYLNDAMGIEFTEASQYHICPSEKCNCKDSAPATICGKCYKDPDQESEQLYEAISESFKFNETDLHTKKHDGNFYLAFDEEENHELSMDFIGPSRAYALKYLEGNISEKELKIGDFLLSTRTIGGHVFWPAHQNPIRQATINQARGGKPVYDRFDITLYELKRYFEEQIEPKSSKEEQIESKNSKEEHLAQKLYESFNRYDWFFKEYGDFKTYVSCMKLNMFFDKDLTNVISLVGSDIENGKYVYITSGTELEPKNYMNYIENCKKLIAERTSKILKGSR